MEEIGQLIARASAARIAEAEKHRAFGEIVRRFQDMAFGCAYAILGDFQMAEDAAQEAFLTAWRCLDQVRRPEAFPGWFKRIVLTQCNRLTRGRRLDTVSLDAVTNVPSPELDPYAFAERGELKRRVLAAIHALPENERIVTTLFYVNQYSHNDIAAFLEVPVTTIKKRLFTARQRMRETMFDIVCDTLQEKRPSRDERFAETVALYNQALESFVNKIKQDRYVLAAILYGSLSYDEVWEKSDIDIMLIGTEEKKGVKEFYLVEHGINIHATLMSRNRFKQLLDGTLQGSFTHSWFSRSTLLFTWDETLRECYDNVQHMGERDKELLLMRESSRVLYTLSKAEKWFHVKQDLSYSFLWIMYSVQNLALIETTLHGEVAGREVIHQALRQNPAFFTALYTDLIDRKKDAAAVEGALKSINHYLEEKVCVLYRPILDFLSEQGGVRSTTELDAHFAKLVQTPTLAVVYEWLADKGVLQKVSSPLRLTERSRVVLDEAAYYYDGSAGVKA